MKYIKSYKIFENLQDDTLFIFDFDDTLVDTPTFNSLIIDLIKEDVTLKSMLDKSLSFIGKTIKDLKVENGRLYVRDEEKKIPVKGNWVRKKNNHLYLIPPNEFSTTLFSLPTGTKELSSLYNQVKNKSIVTGRIGIMKSKILQKLDEFGLEKPNYGLYCYPKTSDNIPTWKGKTIVEIIKKSGLKKAKFYDDKSDWVNKVKKIVNQELPDVEFEGIKV